MMAKRADGSLEKEVLRILWESPRALLPGEVRDLVAGDLAYTSIATILGRLHAKGLVSRSPRGRAFAYSATVDESQHAAMRISHVLNSTSDREAALASLVSNLSERERARLRRLLDRLT